MGQIIIILICSTWRQFKIENSFSSEKKLSAGLEECFYVESVLITSFL